VGIVPYAGCGADRRALDKRPYVKTPTLRLQRGRCLPGEHRGSVCRVRDARGAFRGVGDAAPYDAKVVTVIYAGGEAVRRL
jgi:hypothetical protein